MIYFLYNKDKFKKFFSHISFFSRSIFINILKSDKLLMALLIYIFVTLLVIFDIYKKISEILSIK